MSRFVLVALFASLFAACKSKQTSFTVSGTLNNAPSKVIYIEETNLSTGVKQIKDSADLGTNGKYSLKVKAEEEGLFNLRMKDDVGHFATIINDASTITLDADFTKRFDFYSVSGSTASKTIRDYLSKLNEMQREKYNYLVQIDSIRKNNGDSLLAENLSAKQKEISVQLKTYTKQAVQQSDKPALSLFILATYQEMAQNRNYRINGFTEEELVTVLNDMLVKFPDRADIASIRNNIQSRIPKTMWVGKQAPEIALPDTEGKTVSLSSFRGKYVLVDFWASWCGPCRMENPNVVEAYKQFKDKNFTILGVSLDRPGQKDKWLQAIKDDNLTWTHISDLKFWQSEVVPLYQIQGIPFNVLVDPNGNVIAENLRGSALEQKLQQFLN